MPAAVDRLLERSAPARTRDQADGEIGARAKEAEVVERALVQELPALDQLVDVSAPGPDGVGLVEPGRVGDGVPEPLDVWLAEDRRRPALVRVREDDPVDQALVRRLHVALRQLLHPRLADAGAVEVGQQLGLGITDELDQGAVVLRDVVDLGERPRRRPAERVLVRVLDPRPADVLVGVVDVDVAGAILVGDTRDLARERRMLRERNHPHDLSLAHVGTDLHGEAGVALEPLFGRHRGEA